MIQKQLKKPATVSVIKNRSFAWAYNGMHNFAPMEVFKQETSNAVMTALLIYDVNSDSSSANPETSLKNPLSLFSEGAFHGFFFAFVLFFFS